MVEYDTGVLVESGCLGGGGSGTGACYRIGSTSMVIRIGFEDHSQS